MLRTCACRSFMSCSKPRIAIIGAGVIGLTVGVCLTARSRLEKNTLNMIFTKDRTMKSFHELDVTILAKELTPYTTSDKAGGLIVPYEIGLADSGSKNVQRWTTETYAYLEELYKYGGTTSKDVGLNLLKVICSNDYATSEPWYRDLVYDWKVIENTANSSELSKWIFNTYVVEGKRYLPWLTKMFRKNGGQIVEQKINSLNELKNYDVIINCSGLGAHQLVNDRFVYPIRGQIVAVKPQKAVTNVYEQYNKTSPLIVPHRDYVVLGGTDEKDCWSEEPDPNITKMLYDQCVEVMPSLRGAEVVDSWVGLRPARKTVRLELDMEMSKALASNTSHFPRVIHCYGHGGQGYVLHWGCAQDVLSLVNKCITDNIF